MGWGAVRWRCLDFMGEVYGDYGVFIGNGGRVFVGGYGFFRGYVGKFIHIVDSRIH
jgi:hypothetical protein